MMYEPYLDTSVLLADTALLPKLGLHRIGNPDTNQIAVSLHRKYMALSLLMVGRQC